MSDLKTPILAIIIGEGGSGGALALAAADEVWMMEHSIYAILSPEGFASILWKDGKKAPEAAELMKITASELKQMKVIERVIPETFRGRPLPQEEIVTRLKEDISRKLTELMALDEEELVQNRYNRYRAY